MGALCSKGHPVAEEDDESRMGREIDRRIKHEQSAEKAVHKLLLLGAGESGKSTIFKQIKLLYKTGFDEAERENYVAVIHGNVFQSIKILYEGCLELQKKDPSGAYDLRPENMEHAQRIAQIGESVRYTPLDEKEGEVIARIWNDPAIQETYKKANELQLPDCTQYFLTDLERISKSDYKPTQDDILHARIRTTGIADIEFKHAGNTYQVYDVGGQRNERRKWIHLFDGVTAVIFCAALSEYDQNLFEDETKNRMMETKELFEWVLQHPSFQRTAFLVFLNKYDIFKKKITSTPLNVCEWFRDYQPASNYNKRVDHATKYIRSKFEEIYKKYTPHQGAQRLCYFYETTALDRNRMKATFELVDQNLVLESLRMVG